IGRPEPLLTSGCHVQVLPVCSWSAIGRSTSNHHDTSLARQLPPIDDTPTATNRRVATVLESRQRKQRTTAVAHEVPAEAPLMLGTPRRATDLGGVQAIPINVFATNEGVEVVAPLPGLEPEDIQVNVVGTTVTIHGAMRGVGQERKQYYV